MIVVSTGKILSGKVASFSTALVEVKLSTKPMETTVMGVFGGAKKTVIEQNEELKKRVKEFNSDPENKDKKKMKYTPQLGYVQHDKKKPSLSINALGEGQILVCDRNGIIKNGEYVTTSDVLGHGMKQDDDILHSYTVAKITQKINWKKIVVDKEDGYKKILVACTYHSG